MSATEVRWPINFRASADLVMRNWCPGEEWSWEAELAEILEDRPLKWLGLLRSILDKGFRDPVGDEEPVILGDDGRVWSGHHRILAAHAARDLVAAHEVRDGSGVLGTR